MKGALLGFGLLVAASANAATPPKPLFADDTVIRIAIKGPVDDMARAGPQSEVTHPGTLTVAASGETLPITLAPRGITRRQAMFAPSRRCA